jgi:hypothetical protein
MPRANLPVGKGEGLLAGFTESLHTFYIFFIEFPAFVIIV